MHIRLLRPTSSLVEANREVWLGAKAHGARATPQLSSRFDSRATHARTILPAVLAFVPFGFVLVRVPPVFAYTIASAKFPRFVKANCGVWQGLYYKSRCTTWGSA